MNVFDRTKFDFSFDTSKFGDNLNLSNDSLTTIESTPIYIDGWQLHELESNNDIVLSDFYKNPTAPPTASITSKLHTIAGLITGVTFEESSSLYYTFNTSLTSCLSELVLFKAHTDALSCVTVPTAFNTPTYGNIMSVSKQVLTIVNKTDGIANTLPVLGNFTSLFIVPELTANNTHLDNDIIIITDSLSPNTVIDIIDPVASMNSNLTMLQTQTIINYVQSITTQLNSRRVSDTTFFMNSSRIVDEYNFLTRFSNMGPTQTYLVNNLIGTENLKTKLATANTA